MPTVEKGPVRWSYFTTKIPRFLEIEYTLYASIYAAEHLTE